MPESLTALFAACGLEPCAEGDVVAYTWAPKRRESATVDAYYPDIDVHMDFKAGELPRMIARPKNEAGRRWLWEYAAAHPDRVTLVETEPCPEHGVKEG